MQTNVKEERLAKFGNAGEGKREPWNTKKRIHVGMWNAKAKSINEGTKIELENNRFIAVLFNKCIILTRISFTQGWEFAVLLFCSKSLFFKRDRERFAVIAL